MQFIKKNYEKVLLGLVLVGLAAVAVFLVLMVASERQKQEERRTRIINRPVKPLAEVDLSGAETLAKRGEAPVVLNFSDNTHKIFNPVRWQKAQNGQIIRNPPGSTVDKIEILKTTPLYFTMRLESVNVSDSGTRYGFIIEQQAATRASFRGARPHYVSKGDKKEYGENKQAFVLRDVTGEGDASVAVVELVDAEQVVNISKENPFRRIDGYTADLRFTPENRTYPNRRVGDVITIAGEQYNIVAIAENEVVLSAKSNQKKWTIKSNATP
jgi:hypothetical protein